MREQNTKKCVSKFISDKLRNSMIVNLAKNRFLQQHQKTELINWDWFVILHGLYAAETKLLQNNVQLWQYLVMRSSFIFQFQRVSFAFTLILGHSLIIAA